MAVRMGMRVANWHHAPVGDIAGQVLELDGGVADAEIMAKFFIYVAENAFAFRRWNIFDSDVTGERVSFRADAPHVEIVNILYAGDGKNGGFDSFQTDSARSAFQKDVQSLAQDSERRP